MQNADKKRQCVGEGIITGARTRTNRYGVQYYKFYLKTIKCGGVCLDCELNSGINDNVISDKSYYKHYSCKTLQNLSHNLCVITGQILDILGRILVKVNMGDK